MKKVRLTLTAVLLLALTGTLCTNCKKEYTPTPQTVSVSDYVGEWNGTTAVTRALTGTEIVETSAPLVELLSLRQENGKDTFNFKDPATGLSIAGREGTWSVTQVSSSENGTVDGARLLRLRVITAANRITYTNYTVKSLQAKTLVLYNGSNKTQNYVK